MGLLRKVIKKFIPKKVLELTALNARAMSMHERECPICGYRGHFKDFGRPPRIDALCPNCGALERHRLFWLWFGGDKSKLQEPILHFAPERILEKVLREIYGNYKTADLFGQADLKLNIEKIALPDSSINTIICNHVLEHVDDRVALLEIKRVLSTNGRLIVSVPIVEGWKDTYENSSIKDPLLREVHFGQGDHVRYYGRDFRDRLKEAGFTRIEEITAEGQDAVDYALIRGEKFFICTEK